MRVKNKRNDDAGDVLSPSVTPHRRASEISLSWEHRPPPQPPRRLAAEGGDRLLVQNSSRTKGERESARAFAAQSSVSAIHGFWSQGTPREDSCAAFHKSASNVPSHFSVVFAIDRRGHAVHPAADCCASLSRLQLTCGATLASFPCTDETRRVVCTCYAAKTSVSSIGSKREYSPGPPFWTVEERVSRCMRLGRSIDLLVQSTTTELFNQRTTFVGDKITYLT